MKKSILLLSVALMCLFSINAYASISEESIIIKKDFSVSKIFIDGYAESGELVSLKVKSKTTDAIASLKQTETDENGYFTFSVMLTVSDIYNVYLATNDVSIPPVEKSDISFYNGIDYERAIDELNEEINNNNKTGFVDVFAAKCSDIGFDDSINTVVSSVDEIAGLMFDELDGRQLDKTDFDSNKRLYLNCAVATAINENKPVQIYKYVENIIEADPILKKHWNQYINSSEKENFLMQKILKASSGTTISDINGLKSALISGLILTATRYTDGYMGLYELYNDFFSILNKAGIGYLSDKAYIYQNLAGKSFNTIAALVSEYNTLLNSNQSEKSTSGGGSVKGGGGGSVIGTVNNSSSITSTNNYPTEAVSELHLKFTDLGSVRWAYPSISKLYELGVVRGVNDEEFMPELEVKREEFVKMIVEALKLEYIDENYFSDVDEDAWYKKYVNTAYKNNIVNGISISEFGISRNILRQDMAVMIYNGLKNYLTNDSAENGILFDDTEDISDYATEAISKLSGLGIINGKDNNRFEPKSTATRAEAAVIIARTLDLINK